MRIGISCLIALVLLAAPLFADDGTPVILTMKVHVNSTTTTASDWNWAGHDAYWATGTGSIQSSEQMTWSVDHTEALQCLWYVDPGYYTMLVCGKSTVVSDGASVHGGGSASEAWDYTTCREGNSTGQASWQYQSSILQSITNSSGAMSDLNGIVGVDPWIRWLGIDPGKPTAGSGTDVGTNCQGPWTSNWDTWDLYAHAGAFASYDWEAVKDDPKFQALWTANLAKQPTVSQNASFTFSHGNGDVLAWIVDGGDDAKKSGSTQVDITVSLSVSAPPPPPPTVTNNDCDCKEEGSIILAVA